MDLSARQEVGVGAIVLAGITLFTVGLLWLSGKTIVSRGVTVNVVFANISGLKEGDPVLVSGVNKGRVARVTLERVGRVTVTLELARDVAPRLDAGATVAALDFFGAKYVNYFPGAREEYLPKGQAITGTREQELTDVASGIATRANELLSNAKDFVSPQLAEDVHNTLVAAQRGMNALTETAQGPTVKQAQDALVELHKVLARVDTLLGNANVAQTGARLDTLTRNFQLLTAQLQRATGSLDTLMGRISRGEGTLGKLATDTLLYNDLHVTLQALQELLVDFRERPGRYVNVKVF